MILAAATVVAPVCLAVGPLRPVALTGTSGPLGPGLGPGITFSSMQLIKTVHPEFGTFLPAGPSISGTGAVVFGGVLGGPGITTANGSGIWAARGGSVLSLVARRGDAVPGLAAGYTFGEFFRAPQICDTGAVTFQSMIGGNDSSVGMDEGTFSERSGWPMALVREGVTIVPETSPPIVFGGTNLEGDPWGNNGWALNRLGETALRCFVRDFNPPAPQFNPLFGVYSDVGGPLAKHYRGGDSWTDGTQTIHFTGCSNPRINDSGAFLTVRLTDVAGGLQPWTNRALDGSGFGVPGVGPLHRIFIPSITIAPGTAAVFSSVWSLLNFHLNSAGRIAFAADLNEGGPGASGGFWSDARFGPLQLVALSGGPAPGTPAGVVFNTNAQFVLSSALADNNVVVIRGQLLQSAGVGAGNDTGIWSTRSTTTGLPGNLRLVVREGSPVPAGFGPDYDGLNFGEFSRFWVNAAGRVAFITQHNDFTQAIWIEQADGTL
ncbi:MAG: hypothetical protein KF705_15240, partial [Phycisphaeraceae bacterium]|nr:hypothetical protein [Phycisphaeraceae bacterium]